MKKSIFNHSAHLFLISFFIGSLLLLACQKNDVFNADPNLHLEFSNDSIVFDTVFSTIGSITKQLRVYNNSNQKVNISSIRLMGGEGSQYRINVDGSSSLLNENIELASNDSLYIFVKVTIDPTNENAPFIINDKIEFITNGNDQRVELVAWGQNANYIIGNQLSFDGKSYRVIAEKDQDITWDSPKPYIIYGTAKVDTNAILRIVAGCEIYFHNQSSIWVAPNGCLKMTGNLQNPITLKGDRLDEGYRDLPGQWDGIILEGSNKITEINFTTIENATYGIQAKAKNLASTNQLIITNSIIQNMTESGIRSQAFSIQSNNTIIANCGGPLLDIQLGGNFEFNHCTFYNYWSRSLRIGASILLNNSYSDDQQTLNNNLNATFGNCIIEGRNSNEIEFNVQTESDFNFLFNHCSLKTQVDLSSLAAYQNCISNPDVIFADTEPGTFFLHAETILIDAGLPSIGQFIPFDLIGNSRLPLPDLGAIEFISAEEK